MKGNNNKKNKNLFERNKNFFRETSYGVKKKKNVFFNQQIKRRKEFV